MIHVDESTLLAYLDGQASAQREEVATHVAACARCGAELQSLRDMTADLRDALALTDVPAQVAAARARIDAARREVRRGAWPAAVRLGPFRMGILQAAALALVLAGVAGAAIPGSPLRLWLESTFGEDEPEIPAVVVPAPQPVAPAPSRPAPAEAALNEVTAIPVDGRVVIALHEPPAGIQLLVRLTSAANAAVEAAAEPTAMPGGVDLKSIGGDRVIVTLPRSIVSARITVDGELLVHREGESFTTLPADHRVRGDEILITLGR